ncbi:MAG: hypothetical protein JNL42_07210, partial [Anaerolineae bacterium]|nr:hypothetical protein [Anaerolineae bacterium]
GAALLWLAGPLPYIFRFQGTLAPGIVEDRPGIPLPAGFLRMSDNWWDWSAPSAGVWFTLITIAALLIALRARQQAADRRWFWFACMLPPLIFALGPTLTLGDLAIPLPFRVLHAQTNGMFRMPWRLMPIAVIAGMTFAALALTPFLRRWGIRRVWIAAAALLLLAADVRLYDSAPLTALPPDYSFYHAIRQETGGDADDEVIIEIPTGAASGEVIFGDPRATQLQWYTLVHQKRIVNGFISRAPLEHFYYLETDDPMLSWLGQRRFLEPAEVERQMRERITTWQIGYFVIHRDLIGHDAPAVQEIIGFFNSLDDLLCPFAVEGDAVVYRTRRHPAGCAPRTPPLTGNGYVIDVGAEDDVRYLGEGWFYAEDVFGVTLRWAGDRPQAAFYVDLPPGAYAVEVDTQAYHETRRMSLLVDGVSIGEPALIEPGALQTARFDLPAELVGVGAPLHLALGYDDWRVPAEVDGGGDQRRLAVAVDQIRLIPQ